MKKLLIAAVLTSFAMPAYADYKCKDNRVEKAGSTQFTVRRSGGDLTIEKGGSTKGRAVKRGDYQRPATGFKFLSLINLPAGAPATYAEPRLARVLNPHHAPVRRAAMARSGLCEEEAASAMDAARFPEVA